MTTIAIIGLGYVGLPLALQFCRSGAKVVGISQRRTRAGARFQCAVPRRWDVERHAALLGPGIARSGSSIGQVGVATIADAEALLGSFLADLP